MNKILDEVKRFKPDYSLKDSFLIKNRVSTEIQFLILHGFISENRLTKLKPMEQRCSSCGATKNSQFWSSIETSEFYKTTPWLVDIIAPFENY